MKLRKIIETTIKEFLNENEDNVNKILDKVYTDGRQSLTPDEKTYLEQYSDNNINPDLEEWLFSDDDVLNLNSIKLVYDAILSGHNLIVSNYDIYDNSLTIIKKNNYFNINNNIIYNNKNQLLIDYNLKLGFISCVIFERNNFLKLPIDIFDSYRPYGFPFVYGLYSNLNENLNAIIFSESLLVQRGADNPADIDWWYKCFVEGSSKIFNELINFGYSNEAIIKAKKNVFKKYVITDLIWRKTNDIKTTISLNYLLKYYNTFLLQLLYAVLIIATPSFVFKYILKVKKK
jgi:hypothetical protein